jgi:lysozyme
MLKYLKKLILLYFVKVEKCSSNSIELIESFESFQPKPYQCSAGKMTIGYGHVLKKNSKIQSITKSKAKKILMNDIKLAENCINKKVVVKLTQGQFDALCSLVFNWGIGHFSRSKGLQQLNASNFIEASKEFFSEEKGVVFVNGKKSNGLIRRRKAEYNDLWCN